MKYGLIAKKLGHSFSSELHRMIGGYDYELKELPEEALEAFFAERAFAGINVTIPYKEAVLPYLDQLDSAAAAIGAVNTVVNRDGRLIGFNTDLGGLIALINRMGLDMRRKKVLILGTGGTAKTARFAAVQLGAAEIHLVSRRKSADAVTYREAAALHRDAEILINATPCGMYPEPDRQPIDLAAFPKLCGVVDAVYNPLSTRLVLDARGRGIRAQGGLYMLVAQAALASACFTGHDLDESVIEGAYARLLRNKQNLVLIGMPGCGKTAVGREAAALLGREFVDLDQLISERAGQSIPDIFAEKGEAVFRDLESQVVREIAGNTGLVIATGGGCVLRPQNMRRLRQNGCLILLDRPAEQLLPTEDRPLADTPDKMHRLYRERMPVYQTAADLIIPAENSVSETARRVIRHFNEVLFP